MQEVLLCPAHPVAFGFVFAPMPLGFVDPRLCSPGLLFPTGDGVFYGGCTPFTPSPMPSPHADGVFYGGCTPFTPSPMPSQHADGVFYGGCTPFTPSPMPSPHTDGLFYSGGYIPFTPSPMASPRGANSVSPWPPSTACAWPPSGPPMLPIERPASPAEKHTVLPKSISMRSTGYLKMNRNGGNSNGKHRVAKPVNVGSQRVIVGVDGAQPEERKGQMVKSAGGLEFEVYNQGMFKTELCNKWEEAGACKYADQCQFAHGIAELRPIIRHPRYKTQVCRMITGGALCPYGNRCHFRHSITPVDHPLPHCA